MKNSYDALGKIDSFGVREMALIGIMAAVTCVFGPLSIPIGPVPISLTNLAIFFSIYILGLKKGIISYFIYLLIGLVGIPVFSGFTGGPGKLLGPTGGYLVGFIFMALIGGIFIDRFRKNNFMCMLGLSLGMLVDYAFGTVWLAYEAKMSLESALAAGVLPFILFDLIKIIIAGITAPQIRQRLAKAGFIY